MANTYKLISSVTVGAGGTSSISFTSIPQTYDDLCLIVSAKTNINGDVDGIRVTINGTDTYPGGTASRFIGNSSSVSGDGSYNNIVIPGSGTGMTSVFGNAEIYFSKYTSSYKKSYNAVSVTEKNATNYSFQVIGTGTNTVTAAITSISLGNFDSGGNAFVQNSTAYLYGIKNS